MAIAFRSAKGATGAFVSSLDVAKPAGLADRDVIVAFVMCDSTTATITAPTGFSLVRSTTVSGLAHHVYVKPIPDAASEPAAYTWGASASIDWHVGMLAYSGVNLDTPVDVEGVQTVTTGSTTITAPSVTTTAADAMVLRAWGISAKTTVGAGTGTTSRLAFESLVAVSGRIADASQAAAGATGEITSTAGVSDTNIGNTVALLAKVNTAPNAPILTAPADGATIDRNILQRFDWDFSDPDVGDSQSAYNLRYRLVGATTWTATGWIASTNTFHDFAAGTFALGDYEWQAATKDAQGVAGPYSASFFFTAGDPPATPTITDPVSGGTVGSDPYTVQWSTPDQDAFHVRTVADNAGSPDTTTVYQDTGEVVSATARARSMPFPVNNRYEHIQVRIKHGGLWSSWASIRVLISYTPPPPPSRTLTVDDAAGTISVAITNPTPVAGEPAVTHNDVYVTDPGKSEERRATGVLPNGTWVYRTPASGVDYEPLIRVVAIGDNGTTSSSG
jgi:hypothetical protein